MRPGSARPLAHRAAMTGRATACKAAAVAVKSVSGAMAELKAKGKCVCLGWRPTLGPEKSQGAQASWERACCARDNPVWVPQQHRVLHVHARCTRGALLGVARARVCALQRQAWRLGTRTRRVAFIPFICAGDPDLATTAEALKRLDAVGSDVIELGVPYSVRASGVQARGGCP